MDEVVGQATEGRSPGAPSKRAVTVAVAVGMAWLLLASASAAVACNQPTSSGIGNSAGSSDPHGSYGGSVRRPMTQPVTLPPDPGPDPGGRIDREPPDIATVVTPASSWFVAGYPVLVDFDCTDADSGVRSCPSRSWLDTTVPGAHSVSFQAVDRTGNVSTKVIDYMVIELPVVPMIVFPLRLGVWI
jgi:hypothetical protein